MKCPKCKSANLIGEKYVLQKGTDDHLKCPICGYYESTTHPARVPKKKEQLEVNDD